GRGHPGQAPGDPAAPPQPESVPGRLGDVEPARRRSLQGEFAQGPGRIGSVLPVHGRLLLVVAPVDKDVAHTDTPPPVSSSARSEARPRDVLDLTVPWEHLSSAA